MGTARDFNGISINDSGTGSRVKKAVIENTENTGKFPEGTRLLYSGYTGRHNTPISVYKLPGSSMESGINDLNTFIVRTDGVRDATDEISVLHDADLIESKGYRGSSKLVEDEDGFVEILRSDGSKIDSFGNTEDRIGMAEHYRHVLDDGMQKNQGLFVSRKNSPLRSEHRVSNYYAVPNYNIQNVKHLFG